MLFLAFKFGGIGLFSNGGTLFYRQLFSDVSTNIREFVSGFCPKNFRWCATLNSCFFHLVIQLSGYPFVLDIDSKVVVSMDRPWKKFSDLDPVSHGGRVTLF